MYPKRCTINQPWITITILGDARVLTHDCMEEKTKNSGGK